MYYFVFFVLLFFSLVELSIRKKNKYIFYITYTTMTLMVILRYGQLTDYFNYELLFDHPDSWNAWRDPMYFAIVKSCIFLGMNYETFVFVWGLTTMGLAYPFFSKVCNHSIIALFVFYCYIFLVMPMNAIRQGLCISIVLYLFMLLKKNKIRLYYCVVFLSSFIHISMLSAILIGWLYDKRFYNSAILNWLVMVLTIFAFFTPDFSTYIPEILSDRSLGESGEGKLPQVAIRMLLIIPVLMIKPEYGTDGYYAKAICIIGYCLYCILNFSPLISARIEYFFRAFLCLFVSYASFKMSKVYLGNFLIGMILFAHVILFYKNINSFISSGSYSENKVTIYNFPYISIFEKDELEKYQ